MTWNEIWCVGRGLGEGPWPPVGQRVTVRHLDLDGRSDVSTGWLTEEGWHVLGVDPESVTVTHWMA
jgi:hypothetical protein